MDDWKLIDTHIGNASGSDGSPFGLLRQVKTEKGVNYSLSFEAAAELGVDGSAARIAIYVDDAKIGECDTNSHNWQRASVSFVGSGGLQTIRIVVESAAHSAAGNQLGLIRADNTKVADAPDLTLTGMPVGCVLGDGQREIKVAGPNQVVDITGWNARRLAVTPPPGATGKINLTVNAAATVTTAAGKVRVRKIFEVAIEHAPNPYLVRSTSPNAAADKAPLVAGPFKPTGSSYPIVLPWVKAAGADSAQAGEQGNLEDWLKDLEGSLSEAFLSKIKPILKH
jgi:hypothetical protein